MVDLSISISDFISLQFFFLSVYQHCKFSLESHDVFFSTSYLFMSNQKSAVGTVNLLMMLLENRILKYWGFTLAGIET